MSPSVSIERPPLRFLLGAVFVPLAGVLLVAHYLLPRGGWDVVVSLTVASLLTVAVALPGALPARRAATAS